MASLPRNLFRTVTLMPFYSTRKYCGKRTSPSTSTSTKTFIGTSNIRLALYRELSRLQRVMLKAVIFDLYETLITQFDPNWDPPKMSEAGRLGIEEETFRRHWDPLRVGWRKGCPDRYEEVLLAVCEASGRTPDKRAIAELARERHDSRPPPFENIEPAIMELIDGLRSRGLKLGVVTNSTSSDIEPWPRCQLAPYFDALVASCDVGMLKPDPRIYECCMNALGVTAAETVFVGDAGNEAMTELEGAMRVGMTPLWATWFLDRWPPGTRRKSGREPPFPRLRATLDLLDRVSGNLDRRACPD